jgi:two-component system, chemotaxis family, chemotaxis protein CheY
MMRSVLLIEDSRAMRAMVASALQEFSDIQLVEAEDGLSALKLLPSRSFDLIITDINLPEITGLEVVRFVKEHPKYRHIPVLIISTQRSQADIDRGLGLGAAAYLGKPFEPDQLKSAVLPLLSPTADAH